MIFICPEMKSVENSTDEISISILPHSAICAKTLIHDHDQRYFCKLEQFTNNYHCFISGVQEKKHWSLNQT